MPHKGQPVPIFEDAAAAWAQGNSLQRAMIVMAYFTFLHFKLMAWNLGKYTVFRKRPTLEKVAGSN